MKTQAELLALAEKHGSRGSRAESCEQVLVFTYEELGAFAAALSAPVEWRMLCDEEIDAIYEQPREHNAFIYQARDLLKAFIKKNSNSALSAPIAGAVEPVALNIIRKWPDGFEDRLQHVWLDVVGFIPNVKLYDLQRVLDEFGFMMEVRESSSNAAPLFKPLIDDHPGLADEIAGIVGAPLSMSMFASKADYDAAQAERPEPRTEIRQAVAPITGDLMQDVIAHLEARNADKWRKSSQALIERLRAEPVEPVADAVAALRDLVAHVEALTCQHDDTYRGGAIWTICRQCERKWADDEGGFKPYEPHPTLAAAYAVLAGPERDTTFDHLAGRGIHELRADELPAYLMAIGVNHGPSSAAFVEAATWVACELERKTNDERVIAAKLAAQAERPEPETQAQRDYQYGFGVAPEPAEPVALPEFPRVQGVGRDAENSRVLIVSFSQTPTDTELRRFHEYIAAKGQQ